MSAPTLIVSGSYFPPQVGGIATMFAEIGAWLAQRRRVAVLTGVGGERSADDPHGVRVYRRAGMRSPRNTAQFLELGLGLTAVIARERPGVIQYATLEDAYAGYWTGAVLRRPHVLYVHGNELLAAVRQRNGVALRVLHGARRVIPSSHFTQRFLLDHGVAASRIRLISPGLDVARFRPVAIDPAVRHRWLGARHGSRVLLTVGNLVERKGHDVALRALARLRGEGRDLTYLIVGDGPHRAELEALVERMGLRDCVLFLGRVPGSELPTLYALADIPIMVSRHRAADDDVEGFGIVYLEAAACGKASIGGWSGGVADAIVDGVTGLLVDPNSEDAVCAAVARLLDDEILRRSLGDAALRRAREEFSWSSVGQRIDAVLDEVAEGG